MQEIVLENWTHFLGIAENLDVGPAGLAHYLFRGQSKASWDLSPSLLRQFPDSITPGEALGIEDRLLLSFSEQVHLHLPEVHLPKANDLIGSWALMQHYGAPTRMIDWTASPVVAAYFAALDHWDDNGAIWLIHAHTVDDAVKDESLKLTGVPLVALAQRLKDPDALRHIFPLRQLHPTDRAVAQQGWLTISTQVLAEHSEILEKAPDAGVGVPSAYRLIISSELKPTFLRRLRTMNVTASALFPGIDGLGRSITELARIRADDAGAGQ